MNARDYATAVTLASDKHTPEKAVAALMNVLTGKGRLKLLPRILRELRSMEGKKLATNAYVEVAQVSEEKEALAQAKAHGIEAKEVVVNPHLLAGWRARGNGILIDHSGKKNLIDLYRKITS